ncbi:hypothetical protein CEXT_759721 [Caerostris extrusa]|uniref:Uncharacterized protein n=1 Tax=Caerostris extrusa TaxID=172846 RepID=A0AAV4MYR2_CAEEX|nr:hypothetical protein CEXT_759721 [Caerostris extrusa]
MGLRGALLDDRWHSSFIYLTIFSLLKDHPGRRNKINIKAHTNSSMCLAYILLVFTSLSLPPCAITSKGQKTGMVDYVFSNVSDDVI